MININEEELQCKICYEFLYETVLCDKCSNAFCQECAINYKKKAKKYGRVDKCPICGSKNFTFQRCEEIDKLIKKRKQKPLQCHHCKRIIFDKDKYEKHIKECKYQCKFCLSVFEREDDLLRHIKKNTEELFKALDLMNANENKVKDINEDKPKKKKLVKRNTKDFVKNNEKIKNEKIKNDKNEDETIENEKELPNKIMKKKIIKKKKKITKKKTRVNSNILVSFDKSNINDDIYKTKINKINQENKLITETRRRNMASELNEKDLKEININEKFLKTSESIKDNNKLSNSKSTNNSNSININNSINSEKLNNIIEIDKSQEESKKEIENDNENDNENVDKQEEWFKINTNKKEPEIFFSSSGKKNFNNQLIEEEEKIGRYVDYLNNPPPESNKNSIIPGDAKLDPEYDLFFCGKPNHIDCICCTEHKCKPGACMCISCMKLNKKYHKLKSHYLINKSGRACKYSHGFFHCYCNYTHIVHDVGNNIFKPVYKCQRENICKPCEEITLLMETYLPNTICQKLRDRETKQSQF